MSYVDVVTIKPVVGPMVMRTAPAWSNLVIGQEVMFEVGEHPFEAKGTVVDVATFNPDGEEFRLLKSFVKSDLDMHITKKVEYSAFKYQKEGEDNG